METLNNGAYYNQELGSCPSATAGATVSCDFSKTSETPGLSEKAREMIDTNVTWNIAGISYSTYMNGNTNAYYNGERGNASASNHTYNKTWKGNGVGLLYPSDYGYATSGLEDGRNVCLASGLRDYNNSNCYEGNWLYYITYRLYTLSHYPGSTYEVYYINDNVINTANVYSQRYAVIPTLYLRPEVMIDEGYGTTKNPYTLKLEN